MSILELPTGLQLVAHFSISMIQTWGSRRDQEFKVCLRDASGLPAQPHQDYAWFVFAIRCVFSPSRLRFARQIPDVENVPKLVVDAFTGYLYPDDNIQYVRGVQVEAAIGEEAQERTEVWIFGKAGEEHMENQR